MRVLVRLLAAVLLLATTTAHAVDKIDFNRDIRPILSDYCYACHGPDAGQRQGGGPDGLRLDTEEGAFAELDGHFAIVAGDLASSELIQRITSDDEYEVMPPPEFPKTLSSSQKEMLRQWIEQGASWSQHWAYAPLKAGDRDGNLWIDRLVWKKLSKAGLSPSSEANKRILIRRAYFDVIGLPPSPEEVEQFLNDDSNTAWENLIDRLLASPHFGERMAIYWLDLVRYADTVGYHGDQDVSVSPYRDYVIDAFNANMPFDQFTREQLAGDLLPEPSERQLIASGYNKLGMMSAEGGAQPKEYLAKYASDRVRTASSVWMGSTLGCAECHDHKYDPFTQKDFYQFASFFADIKERGLYSGANRDNNWGPTIRVADDQLETLLKPVEENLQALTRRYETTDLSDSLNAWSVRMRSGPQDWITLEPVEATALHQTQLTVLDDRSILASGPTGGTNTYTVRSEISVKDLTGFRIEVVPDDSLPGKGPGRAGNGNFVMSEFQAFLETSDETLQPLKLTSAKASFEQQDGNSNPYKGWKAVAAIDEDAKGATWGWAVMPQFGKTNEWVAELDKPLGPEAEGELVIKILQNHTNPNHTLGRFRLSVTRGSVELDPRTKLPEEIRSLVQTPTDQLDQTQTAKLMAYYRGIAPELANVRQGIAAANQKKAELERDHTRLTLITQAVQPREMRVLPRGNWMDQSGEVVSPNVPHFLPPMELDTDRRASRLDLAAWLTSIDNPLTARVMVNRYWKMFFGTGLAKVLDDVGAQGEFPTHPELLDSLALEFIESGWNVKHLLKLILTSETYQQSSLPRAELASLDPYNRLLARQSRFRIDAEMVRDNALAVSGLLVRDIGGRSVKPYQPAGLLRHLNFPRRTYKHDNGSSQYRRGVYTHWQRQFLHPAMKLFDAPAREECTAERPRSNTPLAALVMLNDPSYIEAARVFAERVLQGDAANDSERVDRIFELALSRLPNDAERAVVTQLIQQQRERFMSDKDAAISLTSVGERPMGPELDVIEVAAMLSATRAVFNMHEFITRN